MLRPLILLTEEACKRSLEDIGFERRGARFVIDVSDDVFGSVGLNRAVHRRDQLVEVDPVVGVCCVPLETRLAAVRGEPQVTRYKAHPAIVRHLGYLSPRHRYTPWWFSPDVDCYELAQRMATQIEEYALPFFKANRTLEEYYESMRDRRYGGIAQYLAYRLPVAAVMLGRPEMARMHVSNYLDRIREETGGSYDDYRVFAKKMLRLLDEEPG
jgi:hypothetical protein